MKPLLPIPRQTLAVALAALALALAAAAPSLRAQTRDARLMPTPAVDCPRDHLTLYAGQVTSLRRSPGRTVIRIRTDWDSDESVTLEHPGTRDPSRWFLLDGQPFTAADWPRIEQDKGRLRSGLRAAAWVCDDGRQPIVDWQPPRER